MVIKRIADVRTTILSLLLLALLAVLMLPSSASAHASLVRADPAPNSQMDASPSRIELSFNERIEDKLFYIHVIDEAGKQATGQKARLAQKHDGLLLDLPALPDGTYVATYHVVSADGHPVSDSYVFTVGAAPQAAPSSLAGKQHNHDFSANMGLNAWLQYASRIFYYLALLGAAGWIAWITLLGSLDAETERSLRTGAVALQRVHLIALILLIYFHYSDLLGDNGIGEVAGLFTGTSVGLSWLLSLLLAFAGFVILLRSRLLNWIWIASLLAVKVMNGHAMAFPPVSATAALDLVHLAAASLWTGGLLIAAANWRRKAFIGGFLPVFSKAALLSVLLLTVTGTATALLYLPHPKYLLYSQWGTALLVKIGLVCLVAATGAILRRKLRKGAAFRAGLWIRIDLALMALIVAAVAMLTHVAPIPANEPLNWHVMGEKLHMTLRISPNAPGTNSFIAKVWLPEQSGPPKRVELRMIYRDDSSIAPITVPLEAFDDKEVEISYGFARYSYRSEGPFLPLTGRWTAEVRVMDANDDLTVYTKDMTIY